MQEDEQPKSYKVTLKNGDHSIFTNSNNFDNYEDRLVSGMYSITTANRTTAITPETVASIEEVDNSEET